MKYRLLSGLPQILFGLIAILGPLTFASVCPEGETRMACYYTARIAIALGAAIVVLGALVSLTKSARARLGLQTGIAMFAVLLILVPTCVVGVCQATHMHCRAVTLPTLVVLGILIVAWALLLGWSDWRRLHRSLTNPASLIENK